MRQPSAFLVRVWLASLSLSLGVHAHPFVEQPKGIELHIPRTASGASIEHKTSFSSFSFEPAFWVEFFGNASQPNELTFQLLSHIIERGVQPTIRPGGITMDSLIFDASASDPVRTMNEEGGVYRTTVGPAYYESWSNFPTGTKFVSTLNFGNESLDIARDMAVASAQYQRDKILYFELGNEPTNYPPERWDNSTEAYIRQWQDWTESIDEAVEGDLSRGKWWASSATTDNTSLHVRPADLIPAGVDSTGQVSEYSIHSYAFSTCDPKRAALATIPNILNHTELVRYADEEIYPSAKAALDSGKGWVIGEFNSISCSGAPNVSDTFAQALWVVDVQLIYAVRNASAVYLHQGATLVFQSSQQVNEAADDGSPGYSTYDLFYPRDSSKRGHARALPSYVSQLFLAEALNTPETRVRALETPEGLSEDHFSAYAFYSDGALRKLALINMQLYFANSTSDHTVSFDVSQHCGPQGKAWVKRMTAPYVDTGETELVTWAGQSFENGSPIGRVEVEEVRRNGIVEVKGSEAVLVLFNEGDVYGW
ncbi:hypothetical protein PMZ80_001370 [Knufia obscura]|uniref:Beta-glucuronidase C-terminal domain-containing protein n=1 Tax=Knufia obscura TaxID=1635080 RepID=A0ABR0S301_9EURO|nr:hypothetical protein PMZ80_001370 [Knufia obscura]